MTNLGFRDDLVRGRRRNLVFNNGSRYFYVSGSGDDGNIGVHQTGFTNFVHSSEVVGRDPVVLMRSGVNSFL